jgi:hypothetical protein
MDPLVIEGCVEFACGCGRTKFIVRGEDSKDYNRSCYCERCKWIATARLVVRATARRRVFTFDLTVERPSVVPAQGDTWTDALGLVHDE